MVRKREHVWVSLLVAGAALAWFAAQLAGEASDGRSRVAFEHEALDRLQAVAAAERAFHERQGRYAWVGELRGAGLLPADWVDEAEGVRAPGYRLEVLLPYAVSPGGLVHVAPRGQGHSSARLETRYFAVLAKPVPGEHSGRRTFYVDDQDEVWFHEGVVAAGAGSQPAAPAYLLSRGRPAEVVTLTWHLLRSVQPGGDEPDRDG